MSRRRQAWQPYVPIAQSDLDAMRFGRQPAEDAAADLDATRDGWAEALGDLVRALLCGAFVVLAWVAGAWWLGVW